MEALGPFAHLLGMFRSGTIPVVLAIFACLDISRRGERWWWYPVVVLVPGFGPIGYFALTRFGPRADSRGTPRQRRQQAQRRLAELEAQLHHWKSSALTAEAGEELLALRRLPEAEARFREARELGATPQEANLGLAEALVAQDRLADAIAPLQELVAAEPDAGLGRAQLLLARCLDETDRVDEAVAALNAILVKRNTPEARVRLARRAILAGRRDEGMAAARQVVLDARALAPGLRRAQGPWTRAAHAVSRGRLDLPKALRTEQPNKSRWLVAALLALALIAMLLIVARYV